MKLRLALLVLILAWVTSAAAAAATVTGKVLIGGQGGIPKVRGITLADFVVTIEGAKGPAAVPVSAASIVLDQKNITFAPHVLAVQVGATVDFPNSDPIFHNVYSISEAKKFNLGMYPKGMKKTVTFDRPGIVELRCNVHSEMKAYILVKDTPYFAATSRTGSYTIPNVPAGNYKITLWHERLPAQQKTVSVPADGAVTVDFDFGDLITAKED